jgi:hypothetical protein
MRGFSSTFKRAFFNNKTHFNFLNSKVNQNMSKINFSNKLFFSRIVNLTNSYTISSILNQYRMISTSLSTCIDSNESELSLIQSNISETAKLISELLFNKDISRLTCPGLLSSSADIHII